MTDDPYAAPRPSEVAERTGRAVTWWATVDLPRERLVSPAFDDFDAAHRWTGRALTAPDDDAEAHVWKRTVLANGRFEDEHVWPDADEPTVHRDHLAVMTRNLAETLADKKRRKDLRSTGARGSGHVARPDTTMDPLTTRQVPYDLLYDEEGKPRVQVDDHGWIIQPDDRSE